ncbi:hypothetical protein D6D19_09158 [Aureobasidium pullulans]|uniref:Peptidase S53 activation domain-containing protein n=1 Tax=Aureobasidium pullulans TaxID=5580 RepID=A0A4S8ZML6_AURPU|nr:hypothetical protein D6D19_09158 [Aureobasidium pullulans]
MNMLSAHDINNTTLTPTGDWINVRLPVRKIETLLNTTYSMYGHNDGSILGGLYLNICTNISILLSPQRLSSSSTSIQSVQNPNLDQ